MKSKWQEKGVCPECGGKSGIWGTPIIGVRWNGELAEKRIKLKCNSGSYTGCKTKYWWYPASGRITRATPKAGKLKK